MSLEMVKWNSQQMSSPPAEVKQETASLLLSPSPQHQMIVLLVPQTSHKSSHWLI